MRSVIFIVVAALAMTAIAEDAPATTAGGDAGAAPSIDLSRQGTPSTGPCPTGCKCFAKEEACEVFIDCHNAGLTAVPSAEQIDPAADCIDLSQNGLAATPGMFAHFPTKLAYLELHGNKFGGGAGMPANAFSTLPNLVHLGLEQNGMKEVPADLLAGLTNLKVIYLSHNELTTLPAGLFKSSPDVRVVLLQHNKLESLTAGTFAGLAALKVLKLVDNPVAATANATDAVFSGLSLFQLDLKTDNGDYYEDTMLEGLKAMADLGRAPVDEDAVRKLQEQGKIDEDLFSMDDFGGANAAAGGGDADADAFVDEGGDGDALQQGGGQPQHAADGDAMHADDAALPHGGSAVAGAAPAGKEL